MELHASPKSSSFHQRPLFGNSQSQVFIQTLGGRVWDCIIYPLYFFLHLLGMTWEAELPMNPPKEIYDFEIPDVKPSLLHYEIRRFSSI